jgi:hypothetical protein
MSVLFCARLSDTPGKSNATRAGSSMAKLRGSSTGADISSTTLTPAPGKAAKETSSRVTSDCAKAVLAQVRATITLAMPRSATPAERVTRCPVAKVVSTMDDVLILLISGFRVRLFDQC